MKSREIFSKLGKYTSVALGGMTVESYFRGRQSDIKDTTINTLLEQNKYKEDIIKEQFEKIVSDNNIKGILETTAEKFKTSMNNATASDEALNKLKATVQSTNLSEAERTTAQSEINRLTENFAREKSAATNSAQEIINTVSNWNKGTSDFHASDLLDRVHNIFIDTQGLIDSLTQTQKLAIIHVSAATTILFCLATLVAVYFGDLIVDYFKLEGRYPRLARYFNLRRKLRTTYFV